jgi:hypothetical protein
MLLVGLAAFALTLFDILIEARTFHQEQEQASHLQISFQQMRLMQ